MYTHRKITYLIAMILFGGALPFVVYAMINGFMMYGVTMDSLAGIPGVLINLAAFVLFLYLFLIDPLKQVRKLQKTDPALAQQMIDEVETSTELCKNIRRSASFYYFASRTHILVVPIGRVKQIQVYSGYRKSVGHYKAIDVTSDYGTVKCVYVSVLSTDTSAADAALAQVAAENGISLQGK
ncbi:MAG: hypothetical protein MJ103_07390 [Saccharofermentans sp.]|nr:hypothetical protein [Saccharofermentans sp.]